MKNILAYIKKHSVLSAAGAIVSLAIALYGFSRGGGSAAHTLVVRPGNFLQQVSVSGKVVATENVDLSFKQAGRVSFVRVRVGDKAEPGELLASQDTGQLDAQLAEMRAGIDVQKAKLNQLLAGASPEDVRVSEAAVQSAAQSLVNAKNGAVDALRGAYTKADDGVRNKVAEMVVNSGTSPQINFFMNNSQLKSNIERDSSVIEGVLNAWSSSLAALTATSDLGAATSLAQKNLAQIKSYIDEVATAINDQNSYQNGSNGPTPLPAAWKSDIAVARTNIDAAISDVTAARSSVSSAETSLQSAEDQLTLKKSPARSADIDLAEAQIAQAEASAESVAAALRDEQIYAPIRGVITVVNAKVGSVSSQTDVALSLISADTLQIESYVPEKNIPYVKMGDRAAVTLDAYGENVPFEAKVISIDPAETIRDGVSTYRVKLQFDARDDRIKPGMTANVLVTTEEKSGVIVVPQGIVIMRNGEKFVKVREGNTVAEKKVDTGSVSSLGQVEITSGLKDGDTVVF